MSRQRHFAFCYLVQWDLSLKFRAFASCAMNQARRSIAAFVSRFEASSSVVYAVAMHWTYTIAVLHTLQVKRTQLKIWRCLLASITFRKTGNRMLLYLDTQERDGVSFLDKLLIIGPDNVKEENHVIGWFTTKVIPPLSQKHFSTEYISSFVHMSFSWNHAIAINHINLSGDKCIFMGLKLRLISQKCTH